VPETDIHNRKQTNQRILVKLEESSLSQENVKEVKDFVNKLKASGIGRDRVRNYVWSFDYLADHIDFPLPEASEQDLLQLAGHINQDLREELSEYSIAELKKTLSKYYGWYLDSPERVEFLETTVDQSRVEGLKPEEVLRPSEIRSVVRSCRKKRDQALVMTLWASGGRIEATLNTQWKDLELDGVNSRLRFTSNKTQPRRVPVAEAAPYLKAYAENIDAEPEDYIFVKLKGGAGDNTESKTRMNYRAAYKALTRAADRADTPETRQVSPHGYRKSRATFLASQGMNAPQLMEFFGWSQMETAKKYVGLAQNQLESAFNEAIGLENQEQQGLDMDEEELRPQRCHVCGSIVSPAQKSCWQCSTTITADDLLSALQPEDQRTDQHLKEKVQKLGKELGLEPEDLEEG
jgi:integrase